MEPVRVHQHLDLDDVLAFGLGAVDLVCLGAGVLVATWLYMHLPGGVGLRVAVCVPALLAGAFLGPARFGDRSGREVARAVFAYLTRPRIRTYHGER